MPAQASYKTSNVRESDRFAFWREAVCDAYVRLGCSAEAPSDFSGSLNIQHYSNMSISNVGGSQHRVVRRIKDISRSTDADFLLSLQLKRTSQIEQRGNISELRPHDFAIYGSTYPYSLSLTDGFEQLVLQFPKEKLLARLPDAELLTGLRVDGTSEIGQLVSNNIVQFAALLDAQPDDAQLLMQETLLDLVATALAGLRGCRYNLTLPEQHILLRAKTFIQANLGDPDLSRESIAAEIGMSIRRLSEIFTSADETIGGYIRSSRLNRAAHELGDPRFASQTISEIALRCGFNNFQHFSKLFHTRFGHSPSDHRG